MCFPSTSVPFSSPDFLHTPQLVLIRQVVARGGHKGKYGVLVLHSVDTIIHTKYSVCMVEKLIRYGWVRGVNDYTVLYMHEAQVSAL